MYSQARWMNKTFLSLRLWFGVLLIALATNGYAQPKATIKWWNPANETQSVIEGQGWSDGLKNPYDRLPAKAEQVVREPVWNLSRHAAGLVLRFSSNAEQIIVRYTVNGNYAMNHMPSTGVSGVDLYAFDTNKQWAWCRAQRDFSDTITYDFQGLKPDNKVSGGTEYHLFLPLYNSVKWLEIGVNEANTLDPIPVREEKPIVVYGTSIAHGACASRPGMAWTSILSRMLDHPLINLAFSGNGRLEPEVIELVAEIDAKLYVLDCLPNLTSETQYPDQELRRRVLEAVRQLKSARPGVPILLVEHAGYTDGSIQTDRRTAYQRVNRVQKAAYDELREDGIKGLYYLSNEQINLQMDDMVDGTHPNDLGMMHYAEAYEQAVRKIMD